MMSILPASVLFRVVAATVLVGAVAAPPPIVWHVRDEGWGTPAADEASVYFTTRRHGVVAVDINTGRERWRADTNEPGGETLGFGAVVAGSVVAVSDYSVIAFDRATGAFRWRFDPTEGHAPGPYIGAVAQGMLLTGSADGARLHAIDHETGTVRWSTRVGGNEDPTRVFAPVTDGQLAIAGFTVFSTPANQGGVVAVDLKTGAIRWKVAFPRPSDPFLATNSSGGPILHDELVLATSNDGIIYAFAISSGEIRWTLPRVNNLSSPAIISPDRDYRALAISGTTLLAGSLTGVVVGFDLSTKQERWRFYDPWLGSAVFRVTADENAFYLPFFSGEVVAIDADTGAERWRIGDWKAGFIWVPLVWQDRLFVCATGEGLYAIKRTSGEP
jgi:outer membrane protein assembly factor BamB